MQANHWHYGTTDGSASVHFGTGTGSGALALVALAQAISGDHLGYKWIH